MKFDGAFVPYGGYWTTPFCRWQGSFATLHPIRFAAEIGRRALAERKIPPETIDGLCLGLTVPCQGAFYGGPWVAGLMGLEGVTGPVISQACATSVKCLAHGAEMLRSGGARTFLALAADRTSNGPHIYYPNPQGMGGTGIAEDWVLDNFKLDPYARNAMIETAENVAREAGIGREEQEEVTLLRWRQYEDALKDDGAFQRRYLVTPIEVKDPRGRKVLATVTGDEGGRPPTAESLRRLRPVLEGGTITSGTQTFPADGNAGVILTDRERARELARDGNVEVQLVAAAEARVRRGYMPMANVPAVRRVLKEAGLGVGELKALKTHNPFAVNDVYLARELGLAPDDMNRYGCSLVWGHPQAPMGLRAVMELIEELALAGGGWGLFTGCAAGDTAAAVVLKVDVRT